MSNIKVNSPFILKSSFYSPTKTNQSKNASHIQYIGLRSGVVVSEIDLENEPIIEVDSAAGHVKYAHERPRSHGLFSQDDSEVIDIKELQNELAKHEGLVWRQILSLREDDAQHLGFTERKEWEQMLRATVVDSAGKMGIKATNLKWVAAFHQEQGHPHVHLMLWEKEPSRTRGALTKGELSDIKKIYINEIYQEERTRLYQEKTATRDLIRDLTSGDISDVTRLLKEVKKYEPEVLEEMTRTGEINTSIAPKLHMEQNKELARSITKISKMLPGRGRMSLAYMPDNVKGEILGVSDWLLKQPQYNELVSKYEEATVELTRHHNTQTVQIRTAVQNARDDLIKRVGQVVLRAAGEINRNQFHIPDQAKFDKFVERLSRSHKPISGFNEQDINKTLRQATITLLSSGMSVEKTLNLLNAWNAKTNSKIEPDKLVKIITRTHLRFEETQKWGRSIVVNKNDFKRMCDNLKIKSPYAWKTQMQGQLNVAKELMKGVWKEVSREQVQQEARASHIRKRTAEIEQRRRVNPRVKEEELER
jgi:hypothetical protein